MHLLRGEAGGPISIRHPIEERMDAAILPIVSGANSETIALLLEFERQ